MTEPAEALASDPEPVGGGPPLKKAKSAMWTDDGSLADVLSPFVVAATFMKWTDECFIDSSLNHELLFREKRMLMALMKKNAKLDYKTSESASALGRIRKQKEARGNDVGLSR